MQILISYCKFIMSKALKWGISHVYTLDFHQDIPKNAWKYFSWIYQVLSIIFPIFKNLFLKSLKHFYEYLNEKLNYNNLACLILKLLAWWICNMKKGFAKKSIIKAQWQKLVTILLSGTDVRIRKIIRHSLVWPC